MNKYTLEEIRQTQKGKGFWLKLSNELASQLIYRIQKIELHPNWFTFASLVFGVLFGLFLVNGYLLLSAFFINLLYLFDNLDGQWARVKNLTSSFGAMFDSVVDGWNISIIVFAMGVYLYHQTEDLLYLYLTILFFILSFLDFALEKNSLLKSSEKEGSPETLSLQERSSRLKPFILIVGAVTTYDKWILVITIGLIFNMLNISFFYLVFIQILNYSVKLLKVFLQYQ